MAAQLFNRTEVLIVAIPKSKEFDGAWMIRATCSHQPLCFILADRQFTFHQRVRKLALFFNEIIFVKMWRNGLISIKASSWFLTKIQRKEHDGTWMRAVCSWNDAVTYLTRIASSFLVTSAEENRVDDFSAACFTVPVLADAVVQHLNAHLLQSVGCRGASCWETIKWKFDNEIKQAVKVGRHGIFFNRRINSEIVAFQVKLIAFSNNWIVTFHTNSIFSLQVVQFLSKDFNCTIQNARLSKIYNERNEWNCGITDCRERCAPIRWRWPLCRWKIRADPAGRQGWCAPCRRRHGSIEGGRCRSGSRTGCSWDAPLYVRRRNPRAEAARWDPERSIRPDGSGCPMPEC